MKLPDTFLILVGNFLRATLASDYLLRTETDGARGHKAHSPALVAEQNP
jgi:hypothetical protein